MILLAAALAAAIAQVPDETAAQRAGRLFDDARFAEAAEAFGDAYEETSDSAMLFGRAQALRRAGNCSAAIEVFEEFIALSPPQADIDEANKVIDDCREVLAIQQGPPPEPAPPTPAPTDTPKPRRWYADPAGGALLGVGLGVAGVGAGLYGAAIVRANRTPDESEAQYETRARRLRGMSGAGLGLLIVGGGLVVAAIIRYAVVARRARVSRKPRENGEIARDRGIFSRFSRENGGLFFLRWEQRGADMQAHARGDLGVGAGARGLLPRRR